jgi:hypothetical protein
MCNVDLPAEGHNPDIVMDIDNADLDEWIKNFGIEKVAYAQFIHVLEHLHNPLQVMENLWHICGNNAVCYIRCPHGGSDDAWEDPTHVRPYFPGSFMYFAQPTYWRADYGYRGDWQVVNCKLVAAHPNMAKNPNFAMLGRNAVSEIIVTLRCVKPARANDRDLMDQITPIYVERA